MSVTVVGSIAYDAVLTPYGERERMLGGAATHSALAASLFDQVRVVGRVGGDFTNHDIEILRTRGTLTDDVEVMPTGKTFFWRGEYGWDLNSRETLDTQLGVFEDFTPKLSHGARSCDVLFLANIEPALQASVLDACVGPRWTALDSMNLWIDVARDALIAVIERVDCLILNDAELRQLTRKPTIFSAGREVLAMGPDAVMIKQGEYGAILVTADGCSSLPAFPLERVVDPTGAGDSFAGAVAGYVASQPGASVNHEILATAMACGTAVASFNVEEFGAERVARLAINEVEDRVRELHAMARFAHPPLRQIAA